MMVMFCNVLMLQWKVWQTEFVCFLNLSMACFHVALPDFQNYMTLNLAHITHIFPNNIWPYFSQHSVVKATSCCSLSESIFTPLCWAFIKWKKSWLKSQFAGKYSADDSCEDFFLSKYKHCNAPLPQIRHFIKYSEKKNRKNTINWI